MSCESVFDIAKDAFGGLRVEPKNIHTRAFTLDKSDFDNVITQSLPLEDNSKAKAVCENLASIVCRDETNNSGMPIYPCFPNRALHMIDKPTGLQQATISNGDSFMLTIVHRPAVDSEQPNVFAQLTLEGHEEIVGEFNRLPFDDQLNIAKIFFEAARQALQQAPPVEASVTQPTI